MEKNLLRVSDRIRSLWAALVFILLLIICTPVCVLIVSITLGRGTNLVISYIGSFMGRTTLRAAGITFQLTNHQSINTQPCIYIVNHKTTLDLIIFLAMGLPRVRFVAKRELLYNPFFYILGKSTGQIFIDRSQSEKAIQRLRNTYQRVKKERLNILLAPEGTRKHNGIVGTFKKGPFRMAMDLDYPIVPIYIEGARHLNGTSDIWVKKGNITVHIHPAISTDDWQLETLETHISKVRHRYLSWAENDTLKKALR